MHCTTTYIVQCTPFSELPGVSWASLWPIPKPPCSPLFLHRVEKCHETRTYVYSCKSLGDKKGKLGVKIGFTICVKNLRFQLCFCLSAVGYTITCGLLIAISLTRIFIITKVTLTHDCVSQPLCFTRIFIITKVTLTHDPHILGTHISANCV